MVRRGKNRGQKGRVWDIASGLGCLTLPGSPISANECSILSVAPDQTMGLSYLFHTHTHTHTHTPPIYERLGPILNIIINYPLTPTPRLLSPLHWSTKKETLLQPQGLCMSLFVCLLSVFPLGMHIKEGICIIYMCVLYKYII